MVLDKMRSSSSSKTGSIKSLLIRAWKERWSDVQWGIQIKTILPRGCSGDAYNLSEIILDQALIGPAPNALVLGYLKHCLASQVVSHSSVLQSIAKFDQWQKPHCTATLLSLAKSAKEHITSKGRPEDCVNLSVSLLHLVYWLLRTLQASIEAIEKSKPLQQPGRPNSAHRKVNVKNFEVSLELLKYLTEKEFCLALLFIGRAEEKELHAKVLTKSKMLSDQSKHAASFLPDTADGGSGSTLKQDLAKILTALKTLDPHKLNASSANNSQMSSSSNYHLNKCNVLNFSAVQPILAYEVILSPTSTLTTVSQQLYTLAFSHGLSFSELVYQILKSALVSISQVASFDSCKWDTFVLVKFPTLMEKIAYLMRVDMGPALKTPTDLYKSFDRILENETLLDSIDVKCNCNIIELLLKVTKKCSPALITETEADDVLKKRQGNIALSGRRSYGNSVSEDILGVPPRNIELTLKAEATTYSILTTLEMDISKPENMENILGVLCHINNGRVDLILAASAANGNLVPFIKYMLKFNQQSQESQGESVKNSLLRAALFDVTFLMIIHIVQSFGSEIVLKEARGTLMETWIQDLLLEEGRLKPMPQASAVENTLVDTLLQQLNTGDLRTQVVKWQNACLNMHLAVKEIVLARKEGQLDKDTYTKMLQTACSKLCALPICIMTWFLSYKSSSLPLAGYVKEFTAICNKQELHNSDMPHKEERMILMQSILSKMEEQVGIKNRQILIEGNNKLVIHKDVASPNHTESLLATWTHVNNLGYLDMDSVWIFQDLFKICGAKWLVGILVKDLLSLVYVDEIQKKTEMLIAILHVELEECTLALLLHVVPKYLQYRENQPSLTDPHGTALSKVIVSCVYSVLIPHQLTLKSGIKSSSSSGSNLIQSGSKRTLTEADFITEFPQAKIRRLADTEKMSSSSRGKSDLVAADPIDVHPVSLATAEFLHLLHMICQDTAVTPATHFAVRFLEQAAKRGKSKSRLILGHLNTQTVLHLIKIVPDLFDMGFVTQIFDSGSSSGRKSMARILCLLRNIKKKKSDAEMLDRQPIIVG